jgi:dextranase
LPSSVLAAYMDQGKCNTAGGTFNPAGVLLTDATIFAHGGDHIELGDVNHMLCAPYFPNSNLSMPDNLTQAMHHYYDFIVAYENLLRDGQQPTTNTITIPGLATSPDGFPGTVWTFARSSGSTDVLHFVNMLANTSNNWVDTDGTAPQPPVQRNVAVNYCYSGGTPRTVNFASPDINGGTPTRLQFTKDGKTNGNCIHFTLPELQYWDMVWVTESA